MTHIFYQLAAVVAYRPRREVLLDTQLYKPMALIWHSAISVCGTQLFPFPEKGGEKTGENDLDSDTSLVHSQLRVRGDVSPGQYHSTVGVYSLVSYQ